MEIKLNTGETLLIDDSEIERFHFFHFVRCGKNYVYAVFGKQQALVHRMIMGAKTNELIDHINGNGFDNRKENLRFCNRIQNGQNRGPNKKNKYSGFKGVTKNVKTGSWVAQIKIEYKNLYLGSFRSEIEAAMAYNDAAIRHYKEFAWLNDIPKEFVRE
jgi:hypothetical protein